MSSSRQTYQNTADLSSGPSRPNKTRVHRERSNPMEATIQGLSKNDLRGNTTCRAQTMPLPAQTLALILIVVNLVIYEVQGQCPWRKDAIELHADCICDFSPSQTTLPTGSQPAHPINRMSIQCSTIHFGQLLSALKQTASIELPGELMKVGSELVNSTNSTETYLEMTQQLVSQAKLDLLHVTNSSLDRVINGTFLTTASDLSAFDSFDNTTVNSKGQHHLIVALQSLHLSRCGISAIEKDAFKGLQWTLTTLSLADNQLEEVPIGALESLSELKVLDLSNNRLTTIEPYSFAHLNKLTTLRLADNRIATATKQSTISGLPRHTSSQISQPLNEFTFYGLEESLIDLNLKNTQLNMFPAAALKNLRRLAFLNLAQNQIAHIPSKAFSQMLALTAINLERNRISILEDGTFFGVENSLSSLSLLGNLLDSYPVEQLSKLSNLRRLDLGFNNIEHLPTDAFVQSKRLILIALDGNPLETLPELAFKPLEGNLRGMSVGGKVLNCDCRISWILRWQREHNLQISSRERNPQFCAKPHYLRSLVSFSALKPEHLTCNEAHLSNEPKLEPRFTFAPPQLDSSSKPSNDSGLWLGSYWPGGSELTPSYFTLPLEPSTSTGFPTILLEPRRERSTTSTTSLPPTSTFSTTSRILEPLSSSIHDLTYEQRWPTTTGTSLLTDNNPTTSNFLQQLEASATTLQLMGNGVSSLPDDDLFLDSDQTRKINRHGYLHHSKRIKPPQEVVNASALNTTASVQRTTVPTTFSDKNKAITAEKTTVETTTRQTRPSPYGSFGDRASNLSQNLRKPTQPPSAINTNTTTLLTIQYRPVRNNTSSQKPNIASSRSATSKGARLVDEPILDTPNTVYPGFRSRTRPTSPPTTISNIQQSESTLSIDKAPPMSFSQPAHPSRHPSTEMDLRRVTEPTKHQTIGASSNWSSNIAPVQSAQGTSNNTRMSVSSMYRLASPKPHLSQSQISASNNSIMRISNTMPSSTSSTTTTSTSTTTTTSTSTTTTTPAPVDNHPIGSTRRIDDSTDSSGSQPQIRMAATVRFVDNFSTYNSTMAQPSSLGSLGSAAIDQAKPAISFNQPPTDPNSQSLGSISSNFTALQQTPRSTVKETLQPTTNKWQLQDLSRLQTTPSLPSVTRPTATVMTTTVGRFSETLEPIHSDSTLVPTTIREFTRQEPNNNVRSTNLDSERKTMLPGMKSANSLSISPHMFGRLINLTDFDHLALILAGVLCLILLIFAISVACICYSSLRTSRRKQSNKATMKIFPIDGAKQQLRNSFGSSLDTSSSNEFSSTRNRSSNFFCCLGRKVDNRSIQRHNRQRPLIGEDDTGSSGAGSAGSGVLKSSDSASSGAKSTALLASSNINQHHLAFATVGKNKGRKGQTKTAEAHRQMRSYENKTINDNLNHLAPGPIHAMNHNDVILLDREANAANLDYLTSIRRSARKASIDSSNLMMNTAWDQRRNSTHLDGTTSSMSCDSDKSCSPGANRNNHYNISEAHRAYLSGSGPTFDPNMFVSTAVSTNMGSSGTVRRSGLLTTIEGTHPEDEARVSAEMSSTDDGRAPPNQQPNRTLQKQSSWFEPVLAATEMRQRQNRASTSFAGPIDNCQRKMHNSATQKYLDDTSTEDHLNSDLVPMSAEDQWPEPYVESGVTDTQLQQAPVPAQLYLGPNDDEFEQRQRQMSRDPTMGPSQAQMRSQDSEMGSRRVNGHRRTASNAQRLLSYDDAYLSNWHTVSRIGSHAYNTNHVQYPRFSQPEAHSLSYYDKASCSSKPIYPQPSDASGPNSTLLRYRSIPSFTELPARGSNPMALSGATNWLRWTPTNEIRSNSRAPIIVDSNNSRTSGNRTMARDADQSQHNPSRAGWFGENRLEAIYIASANQTTK